MRTQNRYQPMVALLMLPCNRKEYPSPSFQLTAVFWVFLPPELSLLKRLLKWYCEMAFFENSKSSNTKEPTNQTMWNRIRPRKLKTKLIIFILALVVFQVVIIGVVSINTISDITEEQIGKRALKVSQAVSLIPEIREQLLLDDPNAQIQTIAESIRKTTGALFIVVGDHEGRRYSHPVKERLGKFMVGGDNKPALEDGKSYISKAVGTLGPSIRGKVPIFDKKGKIIGIVSVGYLLEDLRSVIIRYQFKVLLFIPLLLLAGTIAAIVIANRFKKAILGLEPDEIAHLLQERTATLETVREGIIAIDSQGLVTTINKTAFETIGLDPDKKVTGKPIKEFLPQTEMMDLNLLYIRSVITAILLSV